MPRQSRRAVGDRPEIGGPPVAARHVLRSMTLGFPVLPSDRQVRSPVDFRILGPLEVHDDSRRRLALGGRQQRALLALLLLHANKVVPVDQIVEELWRSQPPPSA